MRKGCRKKGWQKEERVERNKNISFQLQRHYKKQLQEMKQTSALRIAEMDKQNMEKTANM